MTHPCRRPGAAGIAVAVALLTSCSNSTPHTAAAAPSTNKPPSSPAPAAASDSTSKDSSSDSTSSDTPTTAAETATGTGTACTVLTEKDVMSVLGGDPGVGNLDTRAKGSSCGYGGTLPLSVNVTLVPAKGKAAFDYAKTADPGSGDTPVDVAGIGDGAFGIFNTTSAIVEFYKGDGFVSVMVSSTQGDTGTPPKDKAVALAKLAAGRA